MSILAVDIGGTKMAAGVVSDAGDLVARAQTPTVGRTADDLFDGVVRILDELDVGGCDTCGAGCGGPMRVTDAGMLVSPLNIPAWRDFPLEQRLAQHTGLPTTVENDAKALALGEGWRGAAAGERDYVGMVVSTGVGGGIVLDGRLLGGATGNAGHIGHVIVEPDGHSCGCGARGCLEAEASGLAIERLTGAPPAEADEATRVRTGTLVGRAVATVANLLDLRLAVVAGSVALGYGETFFSAAQAELDRRCRIEFSRGTRIVAATLGDAAPLVGAAAVARQAAARDPG